VGVVPLENENAAWLQHTRRIGDVSLDHGRIRDVLENREGKDEIGAR
jgi:hypothetical protein